VTGIVHSPAAGQSIVSVVAYAALCTPGGKNLGGEESTYLITTVRAKVTCKRCLRLLAKAASK